MNRYPYTDMHEMNLDWILLKVKEMIAEWDTTKNAWNDLHEFVDNYFENLDVQQEINNKLDEMAEGGELLDLMKPYVDEKLPFAVADQIADVVALQISAVVAAQLPNVVSDQLPAIAASAAAAEVGTWLEAHIDPDTGYVIDDTLTTPLAAADAKATGDAVANVKDLLDLTDLLYDPGTWTLRKSIDANTGLLVDSNYYASSDFTLTDEKCVYVGDVKDENGIPFTALLAEYDEGQHYLNSRVSLNTNGTPVTLNVSTKYVRFMFGRSSSYGVEIASGDTEHFLCMNGKNNITKKILSTEKHTNSIGAALIRENFEKAPQVNDGRTQTGVAATACAFDHVNGLTVTAYMTSPQGNYGESTGQVWVSVFPPGQPSNATQKQIDDAGSGMTYGLQPPQIKIIDTGVVRVFYGNAVRGGWWYKDYDYLNDTLTTATAIYFEESGHGVTNERYTDYVESQGYTVSGNSPVLLAGLYEYDGDVYTAMMTDHVSTYPVLCTLENGVLMPFAIYPYPVDYEMRYYVDASGIHGVTREADGIYYVTSTDNGSTWSKTELPDGVQSRPEILRYDNKPLIIYNWLDPNYNEEAFPPMHNNRNSIRIVQMDGGANVILEVSSKYGFVEYSAYTIYDDMYVSFCNSEMALAALNGGVEEQGKEEVRFTRVTLI